MINTPSPDDIRAQFTFLTLDPIIGEPTYESLFRMCTQLQRNAAAIEIRLAPLHTTCAGLVEPPAVYQLRLGAPFPRPVYPGDNPVIPPGTSVVQRQNITNIHATNFKNWQICQRIESLLKTMLENAVENAYLAGIHSDTLGFGNRNLHDIVQFLYRTYGRLSPEKFRKTI